MTASVSGMRFAKLERRQYVDQRKLEAKTCAMCNEVVSATTAFLFDWDHTDIENKQSSISDLCNTLQSYALINAELAKCRLLCCKCHRLHTRATGKWLNVEDATPQELAIVDAVLAA